VRIGDFLILGFHGPVVPKWLTDFQSKWGLGGVILFDYDFQSKNYENNIQSPEQLRVLCQEIHSFSAKPLIFIDQEGGKVRRLKESKGFAPLPSQEELAGLGSRRRDIIKESLTEQKELGIDVNLSPVIDINSNPRNPDIGAIGRSYSADPAVVEENALLLSEVAAEVGLGLCLKHYPGLGGAATNSHTDLTDLSASIDSDQLGMFIRLVPKIPFHSILISHGFVKQWDSKYPVSMSAEVVQDLREKCEDSILLSDDIQMQGLQKILKTPKAISQGLSSGLDYIIVGNNLIEESKLLVEQAEQLNRQLCEEPSQDLSRSHERILRAREVLHAS